MPKDIVQREKFTRLKKLRCFQRVHDMLSYGYPATHVSKFIRDQGEYLDVTERSLTEVLKRYRTDILPHDVLTRRMPHIVVEARKQYTDKLEDIRRLDVQLEALLYRFDLAHANERDTGMCDPQVDKIHKSILDTIRTMHMIRMDLGISGQRHLGTLTVSAERLEEIRQKYGDKAAKAMADPVSRARVLSYLRAVRDAASLKEMEDRGEIIDVTPGRDEYNDDKD